MSLSIWVFSRKRTLNEKHNSAVLWKNLSGSFCHALKILCTEKVPKRTAQQRFYPANSLNRAWLHKCILNTHSKPVLTKVNFGSKCVKKWPLFHSKKCLTLPYYFSEFLESHFLFLWLCRDGRSATQILAVQKFSLSDYTNNFFFSPHSWFLRSSGN